MGFDWATNEPTLAYLVSLKNSNISNGPCDLEGKTVAIIPGGAPAVIASS